MADKLPAAGEGCVFVVVVAGPVVNQCADWAGVVLVHFDAEPFHNVDRLVIGILACRKHVVPSRLLVFLLLSTQETV